MQLLSNEILRKLPALYSQENQKDPLVVVKFFDPTGSWTWYAWEGSPVDEHGYYDTDKEKVLSILRARDRVREGDWLLFLK